MKASTLFWGEPIPVILSSACRLFGAVAGFVPATRLFLLFADPGPATALLYAAKSAGRDGYCLLDATMLEEWAIIVDRRMSFAGPFHAANLSCVVNQRKATVIPLKDRDASKPA